MFKFGMRLAIMVHGETALTIYFFNSFSPFGVEAVHLLLVQVLRYVILSFRSIAI